MRKKLPVKGAAKKPAASPTKSPTKKRAASGAPAPVEQVVKMIPVDQIRPDPAQPRKVFDTSDIEGTIEVEDGQATEEHGLDHPLIVREVGGKTPYELFDGERRWRAARAKGLLEVPCLVKKIPNERVLEKQIALGVAQKGLLPFELADALHHLQSSAKTKGKRKLSADELALRVGLPSGRMVHRYLALATLCPEARQAFDAGKVSLGVALELATISNAKLQAEAVEEVQGRDPRSAKILITKGYHLRLVPESSGFDPADATLPGGVCAACPKSSASQRKLWVDGEDDGDCCTDRACFKQKQDITWERRKTAAEAAGAKVLEGKAAQELYPNTWDASPAREDLVDLDQECPFDDDAAEKETRDPRTWRQMLGESASPTIVAQDQRGGTHELVTLAQAGEMLAHAGHAEVAEAVKKAAEIEGESDDRESDGSQALPVRRDLHSRATKAQNDAGSEALGLILAAVELEDPIAVWRFLAESLCRQEENYQDDGVLEDFAARRGLVRPKNDASLKWNLNALLGWLTDPGLALSEARDLVLELVICREGFPSPNAKTSEFLEAARFAEVDFLALVNKYRADAGLELEELEEPEPEPEPPAPADPDAEIRAGILVLCAKPRSKASILKKLSAHPEAEVLRVLRDLNEERLVSLQGKTYLVMSSPPPAQLQADELKVKSEELLAATKTDAEIQAMTLEEAITIALVWLKWNDGPMGYKVLAVWGRHHGQNPRALAVQEVEHRAGHGARGMLIQAHNRRRSDPAVLAALGESWTDEWGTAP